MRDEYIPAFLELAKAMTDKTLLADLDKYQKAKSESDAAFKKVHHTHMLSCTTKLRPLLSVQTYLK